MKLPDRDLPPFSDLGGAVVDVLPVEVVTDAIGDVSLPDLEAAADLAVDLGRSGSRRVVRVVRVARRHPYRATLILGALVGALVAIALLRRRSSTAPAELSVAEAA
jgi:hypothetical protein